MKKLWEHNCINCNYPISETAYNKSISNSGFALCKKCIEWYKHDDIKITKEAKRLYLALKQRNVPVEIEKYDGYKCIDIAIPLFRMNIEVDGIHHSTDYEQALTDLIRTSYSSRKKFETIRLPNKLINNKLEETADQITEILISKKKFV